LNDELRHELERRCMGRQTHGVADHST
jgi:hypothetical protein